MAMLVWTMVGLALWHFTVFLPDNFYGGIVGAFFGALLGSIIFGLIVNLGTIPGQHDDRSADRRRGDPGRAARPRPDVVARRAPDAQQARRTATASRRARVGHPRSPPTPPTGGRPCR